jgi:hypothetical protein
MKDRFPIDQCPDCLGTAAYKSPGLEKMTNYILRSDLAVTNVGGGDGAGSSSRSNVLALEVTKEASVGRGEGTGAAEGVVLAAAADEGAANTTTARNSEVFASSTGFYWNGHVLYLVSLSEDVTTLTELKCVALGVNIVPVVIDSVEDCVWKVRVQLACFYVNLVHCDRRIP